MIDYDCDESLLVFGVVIQSTSLELITSYLKYISSRYMNGISFTYEVYLCFL